MEAKVRLPPGYRLLHFRDIDSTNAEALRRLAAGERGPLWLWADRQTQGRGRLGRSWISDSGNLYATLLTTTPLTSRINGLSVFLSLAVLNTLRAYLPLQANLTLKWPNDVLIAGRKAAGILVESTIEGNLMALVIGCGLNLASSPTDTRYGATALADYGTAVPPAIVLEKLAFEMNELLKLWNRGEGFDALKHLWLEHSVRLGAPISIAVAGSRVEGRFEGLGEDGSLLLRDDEGLKAFHTGEVSMADFRGRPA
jgi:BirA family transcriptional regulator, biotin operon repressor / biotin---[acetyl-CoA-carboxylase] ligase